LKAAFLQVALIDLVIESSLRILKQDINLIEKGAELILNLAEILDEWSDVLGALKFYFFIFEQIQHFLILSLVVVGELPQKVLIFFNFMLEEGDVIGLYFLNDFILLNHIFVLFIVLRTAKFGSHLIISFLCLKFKLLYI
jgi:hypothetical protein